MDLVEVTGRTMSPPRQTSLEPFEPCMAFRRGIGTRTDRVGNGAATRILPLSGNQPDIAVMAEQYVALQLCRSDPSVNSPARAARFY